MVVGFSGLSLHHMLSGCVQLEVVVSYVCMPGGNGICMLCSVMRSSSGFIMPAELYKCLFLSVSQRGWCQLKSPHQNMWSFGRGITMCSWVVR